MSRHYHIETHTGTNTVRVWPTGTATAAQVDLRQIRESIDESWTPVNLIGIWGEGRRICLYEYRTNSETVEWLEAWNTLPHGLEVEWRRTIKAIRTYIAARRAEIFLRQLHQDADNGGVLEEQYLRDEGLCPGTTRSRPGYWPRTGRTLLQSLELYQGVYGAGLVERIPRYDTQNYHYIRYWLYDLDEVTPDG